MIPNRTIAASFGGFGPIVQGKWLNRGIGAYIPTAAQSRGHQCVTKRPGTRSNWPCPGLSTKGRPQRVPIAGEGRPARRRRVAWSRRGAGGARRPGSASFPYVDPLPSRQLARHRMRGCAMVRDTLRESAGQSPANPCAAWLFTIPQLSRTIKPGSTEESEQREGGGILFMCPSCPSCPSCPGCPGCPRPFAGTRRP